MRILVILSLLPALLWAHEFDFQQEYNSIPVEIDGWMPHQPWAGGMSWSNPALSDIDSDGDSDMFVGSYYSKWVTYLENYGSVQSPEFTWISNQWDSLFTINSWDRTSPDFWDLDNDGDLDAVIGSGYVTYVENLGTPEDPDFTSSPDTIHAIDFYVVGTNISVIDIDHDGDGDLICGEYQGHLEFYRNIGTPDSFEFYLEDNAWFTINVGGYSDPTFCDIDVDDDYDLFIGDEDGRIWFYENVGTPDTCEFIYVTNYYDSIDVGDYSSPEFADIDGDGDYDLFVGREPIWSAQTPGDVFFYENVGSAQQADFQFVTTNYFSIDEGHLMKVDWIDIDADGDEDLFSACGNQLQFYRNVGTNQSPSLSREMSNYQNIEVDGLSPFFCDIDADGDYDLFSGEGVLGGPSPGLHLFINRGTPEVADFYLYSTNFVPGTFIVIIYPTLADIDADEDLDLFLCDQGGSFYYYENTGTIYRPDFTWRSNNWQGIDPVQTQRCSRFWDFDDDGDLDLLFNCDTTASFYRNVGTPDSAIMVLEPQTTIAGLYYPTTTYVWGFDIVDIDADGDGDFFGGNTNGGCLFFRNVTGQNEVGPSRPYVPYPKLDFSIGPNPANPVTWISFTLPAPQEATLAVYNILGAKVTTLTSGLQMPGTHNYIWDASQYSSGLYIIRLETPQSTASQRVMVVK